MTVRGGSLPVSYYTPIYAKWQFFRVYGILTNMTVNINVETKNIVKVFTLAVLFMLAVAGIVKMYDALVLVATSLFFALALNPAVSFFSKYMPKKKRGPAVALVMIIAFTLLSLIVFSIIKPVAKEASAFADSVPERIAEIKAGDNFIGKTIERYNLQDEIDQAATAAEANIQKFASRAVEQVGRFGNGLITSITGVVITILMLLNGPALIQRFADRVYRDKEARKRHGEIAGKMYNVVTGYVNGQVILASVASLFALGMLFVLQIPYPLPLAAIVFLFGLIPLIGNTLAGIIVVVLTLLFKDSVAALAMTAFFLVYQQVENVTLQPVVQGKTVQMPTLVIFVAVVLGVAFMGPIGGLFAIPVVGCAKILFADYLDHRPEPKADAPKDLAGKIKHHVKKAVS